jgi:hypothetical protein
MALISDTWYKIFCFIIYWILKWKVKTLSTHSDPMTPSPLLPLFLSLSYLVCFQPPMYLVHQNHNNKNWKMHTIFPNSFLFVGGASLGRSSTPLHHQTLLASGTNLKTLSLKFKKEKKLTTKGKNLSHFLLCIEIDIAIYNSPIFFTLTPALRCQGMVPLGVPTIVINQMVALNPSHGTVLLSS